MRPIRAKKPLPQVGQTWVGVMLLVLMALALRAARFCSAKCKSWGLQNGWKT